MFFNNRRRAERRAKAICLECGVRAECLAFALRSESEFGVWGGLSGPERMTLLGGSARDGGRHIEALAEASPA